MKTENKIEKPTTIIINNPDEEKQLLKEYYLATNDMDQMSLGGVFLPTTYYQKVKRRQEVITKLEGYYATTGEKTQN